MKKVIAILGLLSISLTVQADGILDHSKSLAQQRVAAWQASNDSELSKANPKAYYSSKLSDCLFDQKFQNAIALQKETIDLSACSSVISEALSRGDLDDVGVKDVIDDLARREKMNNAEDAARAAKHAEIQRRTNDLVNYGNEQLGLK